MLKRRVKKHMPIGRLEFRSGMDEIVFLLDRSNSMTTVWKAVESAVPDFVDSQKETETRDAKFSLMAFDDQYDRVIIRQPIQHVDARGIFAPRNKWHPWNSVRCSDEVGIYPRGWTALNDAICKTILDTRARIIKTRKADRPENVIVAIYTDGAENRSKTYNREDVASMLAECKEMGWHFMFLGANIDAFNIADSYGIDRRGVKKVAFTDAGIIGTSRGMSAYTMSIRQGEDIETASSAFDEEYQTITNVAPEQTTNKK